MHNTTGNENFERVNIKKKETKGKIETLSLRVNKLGSLISKDFWNYSYLFIVRVCVFMWAWARHAHVRGKLVGASSLFPCGSYDLTQIVRLISKWLPPLSRLASPWFFRHVSAPRAFITAFLWMVSESLSLLETHQCLQHQVHLCT